MKRTSIKIVGEQGMGLVSVGAIVTKALKRMGFYVHTDREYMSLIKGGHSAYQVDFDDENLNCLSSDIDVVMALDAIGLQNYTHTVKEGGTVVHGFERHKALRDLKKTAEERKVKILYMPSRQLSYDHGGNALMANMVVLGMLWKVLGFDLDKLREEVEHRFSKKPDLLKIDLELIEVGYAAEGLEIEPMELPRPGSVPDKLLVSGTPALGMGVYHAGVRCYFGYPMTPATGLLTYLAAKAHETGMVVRQIEDEISVAQMTLGAMHMGTRALCGTSGGGFDLMTETVSLAGITEIPLVIIIAQRPGPATGLPTWTCDADLNLAIHGGHGEFPRIVVAVSDPVSCFELIQHAFNYAEEWQVPVIVLTSRTVNDSETMVDKFEQEKIEIKRGLVTGNSELGKLVSTDRFEITDSGVSKRWIPGSSEAVYFANGDEHKEDGSLTEEAEPASAMIMKRNKKMTGILEALPEPLLFGPKTADVSVVGWGSVKGVMLDAMKELSGAPSDPSVATPKGLRSTSPPFDSATLRSGQALERGEKNGDEKSISVNYLHFEYVWPIRTERLKRFFEENEKVCMVELNLGSQLGKMIEGELRVDFFDKLLKWDGRPYFLEEVVSFMREIYGRKVG
jgi:2-oxoglutarate/2-oxoacid ferredoxin oxidoreductase subunit alpha